jgi:O-acetyl-ADP-ribose deacetylase
VSVPGTEALRSPIRVRRGELEESTTDAVVRPVRSDGEAITAVGRRVELVGGPEVKRRLEALGELPVGGAVITPAGTLPAHFVIHAVLQSAEEAVSTVSVQRSLVNALRRARDLGLESVALPPMGTGAGNLDAEEAAALLVEVLTHHLQRDEAPQRFDIVVESAYEQELYERAVARALAGGLRP